jgi:hypothetical protein
MYANALSEKPTALARAIKCFNQFSGGEMQLTQISDRHM